MWSTKTGQKVFDKEQVQSAPHRSQLLALSREKSIWILEQNKNGCWRSLIWCFNAKRMCWIC